MKVYNSIPSQFKTPLGASQLQYAEAFDSEFTLWMSETKSASLTDMMNDSLEVEINLTAAKKKGKEEGERRKDRELEQSFSSNSEEARMDTMLKPTEELMERITMDNLTPTKENKEQKNRNQKVRGPEVLQNRKRE